VIPRTPIFGLEEVEPFPVPKTPSSTQEIPSTNIPLHRKHNESILISLDFQTNSIITMMKNRDYLN